MAVLEYGFLPSHADVRALWSLEKFVVNCVCGHKCLYNSVHRFSFIVIIYYVCHVIAHLMSIMYVIRRYQLSVVYIIYYDIGGSVKYSHLIIEI